MSDSSSTRTVQLAAVIDVVAILAFVMLLAVIPNVALGRIALRAGLSVMA